MTDSNITAKRISLFGPQGSGKGTQAEKICAYYGLPHVSPGNIFRAAIAEQSELGKQIEEIYNAGQLMPDHITNSLMKERIEQEDCLNGFIFDGYPRNVVQADAVDTMTTLTHALLITISDDETIRRLSQRRMCVTCNITYHLEFKPPQKEGVCDVCGKQLIQREDDKPEAIQKRLSIYHSETEPILKRYEERGVLHRIDGMGTIEEVWTRIQAALV